MKWNETGRNEEKGPFLASMARFKQGSQQPGKVGGFAVWSGEKMRNVE
jgi:hypothetical protein